MHRRWALIVMLALAACSPSASASPSPSDEVSSTAPTASQAAELPSGSISVEGAAVDGPGVSVTEALESAGEEPMLVNGTLLQDAEGTIWLCESLSDASPPACAVAQLTVENWDSDETFDPANADVTGLQMDGDVAWIEDQQVYGVVTPGM
jgi:hypothetical protein